MEINRNVLLPNLLTLGNGVCGFYALSELLKVRVEVRQTAASKLPLGDLALDPGTMELVAPAALATAAWLVLTGMLFDVFDGKVARMSGGGSALGAQLDSLCDLVTFGVVPAVMMLRLNMGFDPTWRRVVWFFSLAYFVGAILRLARFTAESRPEEDDHLAFKGLPSPGAAGCVASLVIFYSYISEFRAPELQWLSPILPQEMLQAAVGYIPVALPVLGLILGFTMVSNRLRFPHVGSMFFNRKHSFDLFAYVTFGGILVAVIPEVILPLLFLGYLVAMPVTAAYRYFFDRHMAATDAAGGQ
jgi:CDP-diacylglycerol--serine O-phosphatidyltransferase